MANEQVIVQQDVTSHVVVTAPAGSLIVSTGQQGFKGDPGTTLHSELTDTGLENSHPASAISISPSGSIVSTNIQDAIYQLDNTILGKQDVSEKGVPNGYAPLDADGLVPVENLPLQPDISSLVPYSGATTDVDLGDYGISASSLSSKYLLINGDKTVNTDYFIITGGNGIESSVTGQGLNVLGGAGYEYTNYDSIANYAGGTGGAITLYGGTGANTTNDYSGVVSNEFSSGYGGSYSQVAGNAGNLTNYGDIKTAKLGRGGIFYFQSGIGGSLYNEGTIDYISEGRGGDFIIATGPSGQIDNNGAITGTFSSAVGGNLQIITGTSGSVYNTNTVTGSLLTGQSGTFSAETNSGGDGYNTGTVTINFTSGSSGPFRIITGNGGYLSNDNNVYNLYSGNSGDLSATVGAGGQISNTGSVTNNILGGSSGNIQFTINCAGYIGNLGFADRIVAGHGGSTYFQSGDSSDIYNFGTANRITMTAGGLIRFCAGNVGDLTTDTDTVLTQLGEGGEILFYGGSGGTITDNSYTMVNTAAAGGGISFYGGYGGATVNGDGMTAGNGGNIMFVAGSGGTASGGVSSSTGGDGGDIVFRNSYGGVGDTANGNNGNTRFLAANDDILLILEDNGSYFYKSVNLVDKDIILSTSTGSKFGTATNQKLAFYNSTPVVQPTATTELGTVLSNLGLRASGTAFPVTTTGKGTFGTGKFGGGTDYAEFEADGTLKFNGAATFYSDIDFPIIIRTTGTGVPAMTAINGNLFMPRWAVNDFNVCESQEFVHSWKEASSCSWHIHLTTNGTDATNRYVRFEVEYGWVNPSGTWTFPATIDSGDILIPANTTTKTMLILSLGSFIPSGGKIGGHVIARLKRIASTGTAPTNNPWIPMLQLHIENDTVGSKQMTTK